MQCILGQVPWVKLLWDDFPLGDKVERRELAVERPDHVELIMQRLGSEGWVRVWRKLTGLLLVGVGARMW